MILTLILDRTNHVILLWGESDSWFGWEGEGLGVLNTVHGYQFAVSVLVFVHSWVTLTSAAALTYFPTNTGIRL